MNIYCVFREKITVSMASMKRLSNFEFFLHFWLFLQSHVFSQ